jgi:hypothetical protein
LVQHLSVLSQQRQQQQQQEEGREWAPTWQQRLLQVRLSARQLRQKNL